VWYAFLVGGPLLFGGRFLGWAVPLLFELSLIFLSTCCAAGYSRWCCMSYRDVKLLTLLVLMYTSEQTRDMGVALVEKERVKW
jgi:hypothetical protein